MIIKKEAILAGDRNQFNVLLRTRFADADEQLQQDVGVSERVAIARAIQSGAIVPDWTNAPADVFLAGIDKKFGSQPALLKAEIRFSMEVIRDFSRAVHIDAALHDALQKINTVILVHAISDDQFWWQDRPLKKMVSFLCDQVAGWSENHANTSQSLRTLFEKSIEKLIALPLLNQDAANACQAEVCAEFHQLMDKFDRLANRLKESETGVLKAAFSKNTAAHFLNRVTHGQQLPESINQFLQTKWLHEMQLLLIKEGVESVFWLRWRKLVETLVKYYQADARVGDDATIKSILLNLPGEFEKLVKETIPRSAEVEDFCNEIAYDLSQKAVGIALSGLVDVKPLEVDGEIQGLEKKVTQVLINKARAFQPGQWFVYKDENGSRLRCCLRFTIPEFDRLLFVSLVGQKVLTLDHEKFAYLLSARHMQPVPQFQHLQPAFIRQVDSLLQDFDAVYQAKQSLRKQQELDARRAREENERLMAAEKARAEAEAIAERKAAEEQKAMLAKIADDMKRQARLALNSLVLGSWVDLQDEATKEFRRVKLAVKYSATGRFVFVDADGVTVADCQRDELVGLMMKRKLKLLESDGLFADRLAKIVKDIRKVQ